MTANYDSCKYKLTLPEVRLLEDTCEVKVSVIGKGEEEQLQLAFLECEFISLKQEVFKVDLSPDLIRLESTARISAVGSFQKPTAGFGLAGAKLKICIADLLHKQKAEICFSRGADRKWVLSGMELTENAEIDRQALREKRRNLRRGIY